MVFERVNDSPNRQLPFFGRTPSFQRLVGKLPAPLLEALEFGLNVGAWHRHAYPPFIRFRQACAWPSACRLNQSGIRKLEVSAYSTNWASMSNSRSSKSFRLARVPCAALS